MSWEYYHWVHTLIEWKSIWDYIINDDEFRRGYLGNPEDYSEVRLNESKIMGNVGKFGTIHMTGKDGEDHFVAYRDKYIFDPAGNGYRYFTQEKYKNSINKKFPEHKMLTHSTQVCEGDTFCQTWSLYWLKNPKSIPQKVSKKVSPKLLFGICKEIIDSHIFTKYVNSHPRLVSRKNTYIKTREDFLNYCKKELSLKVIEEILSGKENPTTPT